jgi:hypothetical protein
MGFWLAQGDIPARLTAPAAALMLEIYGQRLGSRPGL